MSEVTAAPTRLRVYRRSPTEIERWLLENNVHEGDDLVLAPVPYHRLDPPSIVEEALMAREHHYIHSERARQDQLIVSAQAIANTLRTMWPIDRPESLQYVHAATAFLDMPEVFVVPSSMVESL